MLQRILTAVAALVLLVPLVWFGGISFEIAIVGLVILAFLEIMQMANIRLKSPETIIGVVATVGLALPERYYTYFRISPLLLLSLCSFLLLIITVFSENKFSFERVGVVTLGALYVGLGGHYVLSIRQFGFLEMLFTLMITWVTDSGAYFVGRACGKRKLAPHISPNKTIEGSIGGVLLAVIFTLGFYMAYPVFHLDVVGVTFLGLSVSIAGQLGDLVESALKRFYSVKDSGQLFPGHGGVLDRFDSTLFSVVACHLLLIILR
ncbi:MULTISPECIES: phosphatidate cytidylyltransferase [unclassified Granulicatella]|uniref:phosphatidate cytidylyltransferase n=1 Tax=unclassified Granulicatella TaxID=2630493 RepID=UPI001072FFF1|nr:MULTISPECIES: phosphatidate cytidylyltransferase [unclassified Granulicatella]MBF0779582.1 phosphatidate cytidylyltransferase [Granulicatella sp. 19428wC4_WM01]TFU96383.1 phosphatidate cytidylyltransferase [Granulicatella sp. WM01]